MTDWRSAARIRGRLCTQCDNRKKEREREKRQKKECEYRTLILLQFYLDWTMLIPVIGSALCSCNRENRIQVSKGKKKMID